MFGNIFKFGKLAYKNEKSEKVKSYLVCSKITHNVHATIYSAWIFDVLLHSSSKSISCKQTGKELNETD